MMNSIMKLIKKNKLHGEICKCIILINLKLVNLIEQKMKIKEGEGKEKLLVW
jgi:hypothetical protein